MKTNLTALATVSILLTSFVSIPINSVIAKPIGNIRYHSTLVAQATKNLVQNIPIQQTLQDGSQLTGNLLINDFAYQNGQLIVNGVLDGVVKTTSGTTTRFSQNITDITATLSKQTNAPTCDVLFLDLGPLFLDLLGLTVDLSRLLLDINAVEGSGKLLGNLLCQVTGLLDQSATPERDNQIQGLLGQVNNLLKS
jgi:hypothetical protein